MSSKTGRRIHLALLLLWLGPGTVVSILLRESIAWLTFLSVYAIVASHWAGWSAER